MTRLVIKLGSSSIASGNGLALDVIAGLINQVAAAQRAGHEILLVTSGAARLGEGLLAFEGPTASAAPALRGLIEALQSSIGAAAGPAGAVSAQEVKATLARYDGSAAPPGALGVALPASVGQPALMALYRQLAAAVGVEVCQILVSKSDLGSARAMGDLGVLLGAALERGLLPVINGNDATEPMAALDNDQIAVAVAVAARATRLLFLTDVGAVYRDVDAQRAHPEADSRPGQIGAGLGARQRPRRNAIEAERGRAGRVLRRRMHCRRGSRA